MIRTTCLSVLLVALALPAFAAEGKSGLPQLDPNWFASQIFWLVVHFVALYLVSRFIILPRIASSLERREGRVRNDLEQADRMNQEARTAREGYDEALAAAREQAQQLREATRAELATQQAKAEQDVATDMARRTVEANERIAKAAADMRTRMQAVAAEMTPLIVEKLAAVKIDRAAAEGAIGRLGPAALKDVA